MQGPHFRYLTHSYVVALGLDPLPYEHPEPVAVWLQFAGGVRVRRYMRGYDLAVVYNHALYLREPDGLAWRRKE